MNKSNKGQWQKGHEPHNKGKRQTVLEAAVEQALIEDYKSGLRVKDCARKYHISDWAARQILIDKKIPRRTAAEMRKGSARPPEVGKKISKAKMGHPVDQKTRDAVSRANKARTQDQLKIQLTKAFITKKKNNSFNKSTDEELLYETLLKENVNKTIYRQYKDENRYPFYCDFYIVEDDLFIELNAHWTHGGKPYDAADPECQEKLAGWQEKAKTSKFYQQAIHVWTEADVKKKKCAKEHNLNYKVIY